MKNLINNPDIRLEAIKVLDKWDWEHHCSACDHFNNPDECPFYNRVDSETYWRDIGCNNFWD